MYYAIIRPSVSGSSVSASFTGAFYDYITESIIDPHKDQGMFIEPMDSILTPINQAEITQAEVNNMMAGPSATPDPVPMPVYRNVTKDDAVKAVSFYVDDTKRNENKKNFTYTHSVSGDHEYFADVDSIQATQNQCLTMNDNDPIPTVNGKWKTAEFEADGVTPVYVSFTVSEFKNFAKTLFDRGAANFGNKESHINNLLNMLSDDTKTIDDIFEYDYSGGWN